MRIVVTGHRGLVGGALVPRLIAAGHDPVGFDRVDGDDVLDVSHVSAAVRGAEAVVHLAALDEAGHGPPELDPRTVGSGAGLFADNLRGLANVLAAARSAAVRRAVLLSSVDVLGCFLGQGTPAYLPIDDDHPIDPKSAYAWSKLAGEVLLRAWSDSTGATAVALRAPGVFTRATYDLVRRSRREDPAFEWRPFWEYGAFIDARDLADAILAALTAPLSGSRTLLVNADDISSAGRTSEQLAAALVPAVPIRDRARFEREPYRALVDSSRARAVLGWSPRHTWREQDAAG